MPGRRVDSADERIHRELRRFLSGRDVWPTYREFQRAGLRTLRDRITRTGGARYWARRMGVRYVKHAPGYTPVWTEERIRSELRDYLADRPDWPARTEFERDGRTALRNAVNRTGGVDRWARELGATRADRRTGIRRAWTPPVIEEELRQLVGDRRTWPSKQTFRDAGLYNMLTAIYRTEGPTYWAERLGLAPPSPPIARRETIWTPEKIAADLEQFCANRTTWPTEHEFKQAGRRGLYAAASRNGGVGYWADRLGLERRRAAGGPERLG